jgi:hypothetical protein
MGVVSNFAYPAVCDNLPPATLPPSSPVEPEKERSYLAATRPEKSMFGTGGMSVWMVVV